MIDRHQNSLLAVLEDKEYAALRSAVTPVHLEKGQSLYHAGDRIEYAYFPLDCIVSIIYVTAHTTAAEIAVIGREGVVGLETLLEDVAMPRWAQVQTTGSAIRIEADVLKREAVRCHVLREKLTNYLQTLITQMMRLAICNRHHDLYQQFSRLLLSRLDRAGGGTIEMSHEASAAALGTSPELITRVAMDLWSAGLIEQGAGHIKVLDRAALEKRTCDCYSETRGSRGKNTMPDLPLPNGARNSTTEPKSDHLVIFYEDEGDFVNQVSDFMAAGLEKGEACVIIATEAHRDAIAAELGKRGLLGRQDPEKRRIYGALDATETLSQYLVAGWPKASKFAEVLEPVLAEASQGGRKRLRLFGEMVAIEFEAGNQEAAIRIEELWNELGKRHAFSLLCAYPIGHASKMQDYTSLVRVCAEHNHAAAPEASWTAKHLVFQLESE